jgi:hypothetical protein
VARIDRAVPTFAERYKVAALDGYNKVGPPG